MCYKAGSNVLNQTGIGRKYRSVGLSESKTQQPPIPTSSFFRGIDLYTSKENPRQTRKQLNVSQASTDKAIRHERVVHKKSIVRV